MAAQKTSTNAVERARPYIPRHLADLGLATLDQLARRLVGEGDCEDLVRRGETFLEKASDAMHEHSRLSAAGTGEDQQSAVAVFHGFTLRRIEGCCHGTALLLACERNLSIPQTVSGYTRKDAAYREAKRSGFRSRAALKLLELDRKYRLFSPGLRVVDLGCWPGGWLQVAAQAVGPRGKVVGIDVEATEALERHVIILQGDVADAASAERVRAALGGPADVLLSDMAPKLSGVRVTDAQRHLALVEQACAWSGRLLGKDGRAVIKLFSDVEADSTALIRGCFRSVAKHRPTSTRKGSSEIYCIAGELRAA
jgi:23S rRNA (uridine2552-2'-O)-methyltransferase